MIKQCNKNKSHSIKKSSSSHIWMWELDYKESWMLKNWAFELWCWRRLLRAPWTARRSNQSILKEISPEYSGLMLELKLQYFGHLMWRINSSEKIDAGKDWGQEEKGTTEDEMVGWHHRLDGHEFEWTLGVGDGQGSLAAAVHGVTKDQTWLSNWTELNWTERYVASACHLYLTGWKLVTIDVFIAGDTI